jgi:hypothetical protein
MPQCSYAPSHDSVSCAPSLPCILATPRSVLGTLTLQGYRKVFFVEASTQPGPVQRLVQAIAPLCLAEPEAVSFPDFPQHHPPSRASIAGLSAYLRQAQARGVTHMEDMGELLGSLRNIQHVSPLLEQQEAARPYVRYLQQAAGAPTNQPLGFSQMVGAVRQGLVGPRGGEGGGGSKCNRKQAACRTAQGSLTK